MKTHHSSYGLQGWKADLPRQEVEIQEAIFLPSNDNYSTTLSSFGVSLGKCKTSVVACNSIHNGEEKAVRIHLSAA